MDKWKEFLQKEGYTKEQFADLEASKMAELTAKFQTEQIQAINTAVADKADSGTVGTMIEDAIKAMPALKDNQEIIDLKATVKEQGEEITSLLKNKGGFMNTVKSQVNKFIEDNYEKIKSMKSQGSGLIEFTVKAPESLTTGSALNPNGIPELVGVQQAAPSNVNLRTDSVWGMTNNINTSLAAYPYTETVPKDGDYAFVAEGAVKPQIDFKFETRYAQPKKLAAWVKLTDESVQDIQGLQSIATDYLRKKHDRKRAKAILNGDGVGQNPMGATTFGRTFVAGAMANAVENPNFMDVVNAGITDVFTTHNYEDEMNFIVSLVRVSPIDFFLNLVSAKDGDGKPLYPTASLYNQVVIGGATIIPDEDIPVGKVFIADMSKYNTTNYVDYTVKIGLINDDFITNQFVILGESRFHAFVKELDKQAFLYDDIATIKTAIAKA